MFKQMALNPILFQHQVKIILSIASRCCGIPSLSASAPSLNLHFIFIVLKVLFLLFEIYNLLLATLAETIGYNILNIMNICPKFLFYTVYNT